MRYETPPTVAKYIPISGALPANRLVRLNGGGLALAGDADSDVLGATPCDIAAADPSGPVLMRSAAQTYRVLASGSVSQGTVYQAANGMIASSGTVVAGVALEAGTDVPVEVMPT